MTSYNKSHTVAFTGHRIVAAMGNDLFSGPAITPAEFRQEVSQKLHTVLSGLYNEGYRRFLCGMAMGFDMMAAGAVLDLKRKYIDMELIAIIPHPGQTDTFSHKDKQKHEDILRQVSGTIMVSPTYTPDCFHRRNDYLIDNCSAVVCFYNGSKGGTDYTVKRALRNGLKIINVADI